MELTPIQTEMLVILVNLFRQKGGAVKGEEIANVLHRNSGTIRNQMQALRALRMVESVSGPKGGYRPTSQAYDVLDIIDQPGGAATNIYRNGKLVDGATVCEIIFTAVHHPNTCNGRVRVIGDIREFDNGDVIKIGPTPKNELVIRGKVIGRDDTRNILIFVISDLLTLPKRHIRECVQVGNITIDSNATINDAANTLLELGSHGAPVIDKKEIIGVVTLAAITRSLVSGLTNQKVRDVMSRDPITIDGDTPISNAVKLFDQYRVNTLVVLASSGKPYGVVFKVDVLRESDRFGESIIAPSFMSA